VAEAGKAIEQTTAKFRGVAEDVRSMAATITKDLEVTRSEIARGVFELPRDTQQSTAAMRRVVAEQIRALNELNEIVNRAGRARNDGQPAQAQAPARPQRAPQPAAQAPRTVQAAADDSAPLAWPVASAASRAQTPAPQAPSHQAPAPTAPARREPTPARQREEARAEGGWLSNLLTRASDEAEDTDQPQPSMSSAELLDTLSIDIGELINMTALEASWARRNRGEAHAFGLDLYTARGQKIFDDARARYRMDPEFRQTADRYVEEFDRLLVEVRKSDRDGAMARNYLTSDTGKVYTILAHASGRLDRP